MRPRRLAHGGLTRRGRKTQAPDGARTMTDILFLALGGGLLAACILYTLLCERL